MTESKQPWAITIAVAVFAYTVGVLSTAVFAIFIMQN